MHRAKYYLRRLRIWQWLLGGFVVFVLVMTSFVSMSLGQLSDLGLLRLTGFPGGQDYLVVFQNDAERRPTGGFISAYATLKFRFGMPLISFGNVYDERLIQKGTQFPDSIVQDLIGGPQYPGHGFRDGNADPDWPTSAKELMRLYQLGYPDAAFDGVIAIDFTAFAGLVDAVGSIRVGEQTFAGDTLFAQMEQEIQTIDLHNPAELAARKGILGQLAKGLIRNLIFSPGKLNDITDSLVASLASKHVLFYFTDTEMQARTLARDWAGELPFVTAGDMLAVVEGNYGGMKSSRYLLRSTNYDVRLTDTADGSFAARAELDIAVEHRGDAAEPISGYYKGYWRVFAPLGSQLISGRHDVTFDDGTRQVFGRVIEMNPAEERDISLKYDLPDSAVKDGVYHLRLVKQPGSAADHIRVTVKAPAGYLFASDQFDIRENLAVFETNLAEDTELALEIVPDTVPPGLAWQEFRGGVGATGLRQIDLRFGEPLDSASVAGASFRMADLDYRNDRTDSISVQRAEFIAPQNIRLYISGIREECREWYALTIDGVADLHGNAIDERTVTVVQSLNNAGQLCDPEREL